MKSHPHIANLPRLMINSYSTRFWRYQTGEPRTSLATLEAIYFFAREFELRQRVLAAAAGAAGAAGAVSSEAGGGGGSGGSGGAGTVAVAPYDGSFDNLLVYYHHMYHQIQDAYKSAAADTTRKKFTNRHYGDYIKYDDDSDQEKDGRTSPPPPPTTITTTTGSGGATATATAAATTDTKSATK